MKKIFLMCVLMVAWAMTPARAWHLEGHHIMTLAAMGALPDEVPAFFREGAATVAHMSIDPDMAKHRGTPHVRAAEYPEHFLDREMLPMDVVLPKSRYEFVKLCYEHKVAPEKMGFLPYALGEWTERLAVAFAEYRKWPNNPHIQQKCLIYAGFIAHYAEDLCQPLHLTIHYDGRVLADGSKTDKGIHSKVDGLVELLALKPEDLARGQKIEPMDDLMAGIMAEFTQGFALVDRVYDLGPRLPSAGDKAWKRDAGVVAFTEDRARTATRFTAQLYLTAWRMSEPLTFDDFINRPKWDGQ